MKKYTSLILLFHLFISFAQGQINMEQIRLMQTTPQHYQVVKTSQAITIDGKDNETAWNNIAWTNSFVDIQGTHKKTPIWDTKVKMMWDDQFLYIYAQLEEPHIWGNITQHDAIIYHNNDFEIFIKPYDSNSIYYEIEVNTLNTLMDLMMPRPYRLAGEAIMHWDMKGIQSAVHIEGTNNDPTHMDKYWSVEMAIPFSSINNFGRAVHPREGEHWRINFSRVQWQHEIINNTYFRKKVDNKLQHEDNWVWSPIGLVNMHYPERWGFIQFVNNRKNNIALPDYYALEKLTWNIFYLQQIHFQKNKRYATSLTDLAGYDELIHKDLTFYNPEIITNKSATYYRINLQNKSSTQNASIDSNGQYIPQHD